MIFKTIFSYQQGIEKRFSTVMRAFFHDKRYFLPSLLAIINALITYFALVSDNIDSVFAGRYAYNILFGLNIFFIFLLSSLVIYNIYHLRISTKNNPDGSRFRYRLVVLFTLAALLPSLMIAIFSAITFKKAADGWFEVGVENAIYNAQSVSNAYIQEHNHNITADSFATASDLKKTFESADFSPNNILKQMQFQLLIRDLNRITLYSHIGQVIASVNAPLYTNNQTMIPSLFVSEMLMAKQEIPHISLDKNGKQVYALLPFSALSNHYFIRIDRKINIKAVEFQKNTSDAVNNYEFLKHKKHIAETGFALIYIAFGLAAITFMVHAGTYFATQMTTPLEQLTHTLIRIESGDTTAIMPEPVKIQDEIDRLISAFNRMNRSLNERTKELINANQDLDIRRKLNETVLLGVSSGVLGVNHTGDVKLFNKRSQEIFDIFTPITSLSQISGELSAKVKQFTTADMYPAEFDYQYMSAAGEARHLHIRLSLCGMMELHEERTIDIVITIDDVTELLKAQSMAAWRDVARRIAHEIKNPLTPIALSAERIKRKWKDNIHHDADIFNECIDTILRQVDHIRETTDSFANFAKTPMPIKGYVVMNDIIKQVIFLEQMRCPHTEYHFTCTDDNIAIYADKRLLSQALINIMKNASESIARCDNLSQQGKISIYLSQDNQKITVNITDNGAGLPDDVPSYKLFEPYITQNEQGTGLGLAITAKIITDHQGRITIAPHQDGAVVTIILPSYEAEA